MKLIAMVAGVLLAVPVLAQNPPPAKPDSSLQAILSEDPGVKKAKTLLQQMIQALGGDAYMNLQDMEQQGRTYAFYHGTPTGGAPYWRFWKWPDKDRFELTKQRDVIYIYNGDTGWEITYKGTRLEEPDEVKEYLRNRHFSLEHVLRRWLKEPGTALFYDGAAIAQQHPAEKVTLINSRNQAVTLFIDLYTHLPVKKSYQVRDPQTRQLDEEAEAYDNWRMVQGINTPHSIIAYHNGEMSRQRFIESVRYNLGLPDSQFTAAPTYSPQKR